MRRFLSALACWAVAFSASAQSIVTINNLPAASALSGTEPVPIWQNGGAVRTTPAAIAALAAASAVSSFNTRTGAITLSSGDVTSALGYTPVNITGATPITGRQAFAGATASAASINIPQGTSPTSPNNGDCWTTSVSFECRINGVNQIYANLSSGVSSFNTRTGAVVLTSSDVTTALGYTPLVPSNNLSDLASFSTARTNLGLGGAAVLNVGTTAGTVAAGNDSRFAGPTQNSQSAAYGLVLSDAGGQIYHPASDTTARTWTIPANASVAFSIGTKIDLVNDCSAGVITLAITSDTLVFFPSGSTGSRSIAACGEATLTKVGSQRWILVGVGLS